MDVLNNREWAILIWLIALLMYVVFMPKMEPVRHSALKTLKCFFVWKIQALLLLALFYVSLVVYFLHEMSLWHIGQLKNTLIWFIAVAFLSFFDLDKYKKNSGLFKRTILDSIKLITLVEFLISFYVLPILAELIFFPILVLITMMHAYSLTDKKYKSINNLFETILALIGLSLIVYAIYELVTNFSRFAKTGTVEDFLLPPLLTFTFLPFIFFMVVYTTYENIFVGLQFSIKDKRVKRFTKVFTVIVFNVRFKQLERWMWMLQVRDINYISDIFSTWKYLRNILKIEKNPPTIPRNEGWSPYQAQGFIKSHGIETGYYKELEGEWFSCSPPVEFGEGLFPSIITYYIDGTRRAANSLKLSISVNDSNNRDQVKDKMLEVAETLYQKSVGKKLPEEFQKIIFDEEKHEHQYGPYKVSFKKDVWPNHSLKGYSLNFHISIAEGD